MSEPLTVERVKEIQAMACSQLVERCDFRVACVQLCDALLASQARAEQAEAEAAVKSECVAFFACTVKCGERWTPTCDEYLAKSKLNGKRR